MFDNRTIVDLFDCANVLGCNPARMRVPLSATACLLCALAPLLIQTGIRPTGARPLFCPLISIQKMRLVLLASSSVSLGLASVVAALAPALIFLTCSLPVLDQECFGTRESDVAQSRISDRRVRVPVSLILSSRESWVGDHWWWLLDYYEGFGQCGWSARCHGTV